MNYDGSFTKTPPSLAKVICIYLEEVLGKTSARPRG